MAGIKWTLASDLLGYDSVNYGLFYDDVQYSRIALKHYDVAKQLGVKKILMGECGHAHKATMPIADRVVPKEMYVPGRERAGPARGPGLQRQAQARPVAQRFPGHPARPVQHHPLDGHRPAPAQRAQGDLPRSSARWSRTA